jgi:hypothetical protein
MGGAVSGLVDTVGNTLSGGADLYKQIEQPIFNNAGLIGTGVGAAFGQPALGAAIGGAVQGKLGDNPSSPMTSGLLSAAGGYLQNQSNVAGNQTAAQASQFRPVGITNTFGTSNFQIDPATGQMISAGYQLSPQLQGYQNTLMGNNAQALTDASQIQAMGRQYMAQSPQQQAQQYLANQQALLQPGRDTESARLANQLQQTGRTGVSVAQGGGLGMANPEQQALANARAMQDLQLAANATQAGQQQYQFGQGLLSSAYQPFSAGLSASGAVEQLGQQPFGLSSELAGRSSTAGAKSADYLKAAGQTNTTAQLLGGASGNSLINSLFSSGGNALSGLWDQYTNPITVDTSGAGLGSWGNVDTSLYGGANGVSIR